MSPAALLAPLAAALFAAAAPEPVNAACATFDGWKEYRSQHFALATDLSRMKASLLLGELELLRELVLQAMVGGPVEIPGGRLRVFAPGSPRLFAAMARSADAQGYFIEDRWGMPAIVLQGMSLETYPEIIAHELVHHLSWYLFPRQPPWFAEGLADFMQTVAREQTDDERVTGSNMVHSKVGSGRWAGAPPPRLHQGFMVTGPVDPKSVLEWQGRSPTLQHYLWSWTLFHYLWTMESKRFGDYQERLGRAEDPAAAWRAAFPEYAPDSEAGMKQLADKLDSYRRQDSFVMFSVKAKVEPEFTEALLPSADVHVLRCALSSRPERNEVLEHLQEALREDPLHPDALGWLFRLTGTPTIEPLRRRVANRPHDARGWLALAKQASGDEKEQALRKAIELAPDDATALNSLAWHLYSSGKAKQALRPANRAAELAPWSAMVLDTLALTAGELGKCAEALVLQRRAVALSDDPAIAANLQRLEARCTKAPPPREPPAP